MFAPKNDTVNSDRPNEHERQFRAFGRCETVTFAEPVHVLMGQPTALVGDVVPDQWDAVIPGEQQSSFVCLEESAARVVLHQGRQAGFTEQFPRQIGSTGEETADRHRLRRFVAEHAGIRGAVQRDHVRYRIGHARPGRDQIPPFLAEHLPGEHHLDPVRGPTGATVEHVLDERRVAQQHDLLEMGRQVRDDPQDLGLVIAGRDRRNRESFGRQVPDARRGVQPADPCAQREADNRQRAARIGLECAEDLLETLGDMQLVDQ
jgi:hypothetical protein